MSLVATDGHRLALVTVAIATASRRRTRTTAKPGDPAEENARRTGAAARRGRNEISYERGENHLFFNVGDRVLISRMIDGQFPAYERVIPERERQAHRVRARSADQRGEARGAALERAVAGGQVPDRQGKSRRHIEQPRSRRGARNAAGRLRRRADADLLQRAIRARLSAAVATDVVASSWKDEVSQAVMKPVGAEGYDYTYVIMPMRV